MVNLFFEDSTRTRSSLRDRRQVAVRRRHQHHRQGLLGVSKGECLRDTVLTVDAMGVDALVIRHRASGAAHQVASGSTRSVINAGDGTHEHPTQALLDAYTLQRGSATSRAGTSRIVGDLTHCRVFRSNVHHAAARSARRSRVVAPPTLMPSGIDAWAKADGLRHAVRPRRGARPTADAVMMLRVQRERMSGGYFPTAREYTVGYGLTRDRLRGSPPQPGRRRSATPAR